MIEKTWGFYGADFAIVLHFTPPSGWFNKFDYSNKQFGFLKEKGTKDTLAYVSNLIYDNFNRCSSIIATFLDLEKSFDTVDHNILFKKLYQYGIIGKFLELMVDYLTDTT